MTGQNRGAAFILVYIGFGVLLGFLGMVSEFVIGRHSPLGSCLTCLFVGWFVPAKVVRGEFADWGAVPATFYQVFLFTIRFICPICILAIFLHQCGVF